MANTNNTKQAIRQEIDRLQGQSDLIKKRVKELKEKRDSLLLRQGSIDAKIADLRIDLNA